MDHSRGVGTFERKHCTVRAVEVNWANWNDICDFLPVPDRGYGMEGYGPDLRVMVYTGGVSEDGGRYSQVAKEGDWLVRAGDDLHVFPPDHFEAQFRPSTKCQHRDSYWQMGTADLHPICAQCGADRNG